MRENETLWDFWPMLGVGWQGVVGIGIYGNHKELFFFVKVVDWQQMDYTCIFDGTGLILNMYWQCTGDLYGKVGHFCNW